MSFHYEVDDDFRFTCNLECRQCQGTTKAGNDCRRNTCKSLPYCHQHLKSELGLFIDTSTIRNAGNGLFTYTARRANEYLAPYIGKLLSVNQLNEMYGNHIAPYAVRVSGVSDDDGVYLDAACARGIAAFANHKENANARWAVNHQDRSIYIVATKRIKAGDEIFLDYGDEYFKENENARYRTTQRKVRHPTEFVEEFKEPKPKKTKPKKRHYPDIPDFKEGLYAAKSAIHGKGLFSSVPIKKGSIITCVHDPIEMEEANVNWPEDSILHIKAKNAGESRARNFAIFDGAWSVPDVPPMWYYQNHSASPNSEMKLYSADDRATVCFVAKKDIAPHEEIVFNYEPGKTLHF